MATPSLPGSARVVDRALRAVVDLVEKGAGTVVHLRILPGTIEDYATLVARVVRP